MKLRDRALVVAVMFLTGCATYHTAERVKMVSFTGDLKQGQAAGPIRGEDCTWSILGYQMGGIPTVDRAFINAMNQAGAIESAGFGVLAGKSSRGDKIRYVNNVSTKNEGFSAVVFGKQCIVVTGIGYR